MEHYTYQPLRGARSIRLLSVTREFADLGAGPIYGSLTELNLDQNPEYEALSYCWGNPELNVPIICDGRVMYVTRNCDEALRRLLRGKWSRSIWVDAICINQYDLQEKNQQVQMMGDIYRHARAIRVWLGPQSQHSDAALSSLKSLTMSYVVAIAPGPFKDTRQRVFDKSVRQMADRDAAFGATLPFGLFGEIFRRPWFSRMWVIQEVVMPESSKVMLYCGDHMIHLTNLAGATNWSTVPSLTLSQRRWFHYAHFIVSLKDAISARESGRNPGMTLSQVLSMVRLKEATNPRDKIYALYSVARRLGWQLPVPRYEQPVIQVFTEATIAAMRTDQSLEILHHADNPRFPTDGPSWVPNYARQPSISNADHLRFFTASGRSQPRFSFSPDATRLSLHGIFIDVVSTRSSTIDWEANATLLGNAIAPPPELVHSSLRVLREWTRFSYTLPPTVHGDRLDSALAQTLFMDPNRDQATAAFHQLQTLQTNISSTLPPRLQGLSDPNIFMLERLLGCNIGMTLIYTEGGRIGTAPGSVEPGDVVVLLAGASAPAVLRQTGESFLLVGFAYIYGVMNGELWTFDVESRLEEYTIV